MDQNERIIELFLKAKYGDYSALGRLYPLLYTKFFNYCRSILRDFDYSDAEDVTSETILAILEKLENIDDNKFINYCFTSFKRKSLTRKKQLEKERKLKISLNKKVTEEDELEKFIAGKYPTAEEIAKFKERYKRYLAAILKLPEKQKAVGLLMLLGYEAKEMAEMLKFNYNYIRVLIMRVRKYLRGLGDDGPDPDDDPDDDPDGGLIGAYV